MDYFLVIWSVTVFIENRIESGFDYAELEKCTGFSLSHLRAIFAGLTGTSLSRYILERRVSHAAFDLIHSEKSILDIAVQYGFQNPDTFTRAFKRITNRTPQEFRKQRPPVGNIKLCAGVFGVSERILSMEIKPKNTQDSTVLYGVPKVGYGVYGCTPFPICLKGAANYLGEDVDYDYAMTASGAAFRLTWDETCWNGGNVDVLLAFDDPIMAFKKGIEVLGREFTMLCKGEFFRNDEKNSEVKSNATKEEFINFIREQIDKGSPCIGLGFIGPPEACLITGYRDNGKTLLGWNFFQDSPEFATQVKFDESGYFITDRWWENAGTYAVMSLGEKVKAPMPLKELVHNAVTVLSGRKYGDYAKGILAYETWKKAITDESQFPKDLIMPLLVERLMCQGDGMDCLADGRDNAAKFFAKQAEKNPGQPLFAEIAMQFGIVRDGAFEMYKTLGGWCRDEKQLKALAQPETRRKLAKLIDRCKAADTEALALLKKLEQVL
ncbi:MAG TPA: AraC family transcriptional regulator [Oscillospiraceae bacterium]|nr:AraC family transcriptional regulator [Oscillospiraceae bacterium]HPF55724.1 AraC family transcriptional regulator [Clostridiales bacterium]HPK36128.1 AraC family transcriptional regulator [Oscillospiraceae bacterium]HPR76478.1 AraC family transcriptional regulator [Oscillospiraceae bacterium]